MKMKVLLAMCLLALLAGGSVYGQSPESIKAKIDFPFTVEGKVLPAGNYEFTRTNPPVDFRVTEEGKNVTMVPIMTRLSGEMHTTPQDAHLVFDVVGDTYFLSEIWIPGEDGYLFLVTKGKHEHKVINVKR
jgi:hypothetical protein